MFNLYQGGRRRWMLNVEDILLEGFDLVLDTLCHGEYKTLQTYLMKKALIASLPSQSHAPRELGCPSPLVVAFNK